MNNTPKTGILQYESSKNALSHLMNVDWLAFDYDEKK
jgi:hypothetical protein